MASSGAAWAAILRRKAAAVDKRIKSLVAWGALYKLLPFDQITPITQKALMFISGTSTPKEAGEFYSFMDLTGFASRIACPTLVIHGGLDKATPIENANRLVAEVAGPLQTLIWDDSGHCCHDRSHIMRPAIGDFLANTL